MMYLVLVELNARPADQYPDLEKAIKALGNWSSRMRGVWMIESRFTAAQIRDLLKPALDVTKDKLFVSRMTPTWSGTGLGQGFPEWMERRKYNAPKK